MGHHVWADVVPFVAHNVVECSTYLQHKDMDDSLVLLLSPETWAEGEHLSDEEYTERGEIPFEKLHGLERNNWWLDTRDDQNIGKNARLYGFRWRKNKLSVWLINESEYSNVGEFFMAVCANDRNSVEQFLKDWNLNRPVEEFDSVTQSG